MVDNNLNIVKNQNGEEDSNTIAQRFLNIFRQLHVFTPERKRAFDDLILSQPAEIRGMFGKLLGGASLQEYVNELERNAGMESSFKTSDYFEKDDILQSAMNNSSKDAETAAVMMASTEESPHLQKQMLEMMNRLSQQSASSQSNFDTKKLEGLVNSLVQSQTELLANITKKQTEQLSKIITLSLQESYQASTLSFIEAMKEMNNESINMIKQTLDHQNERPIMLNNYINNSNPTQINQNHFEPSENNYELKGSSHRIDYNNTNYQESRRKLEELEDYSAKRTQYNENDEDNFQSKKKKKNKKKKNRDDNWSAEPSSFAQQSERQLERKPFHQQEKAPQRPQQDENLDYSLFGDEDEFDASTLDDFKPTPIKEVPTKQKQSHKEQLSNENSSDDDDNYEYEYEYVEQYVEPQPKINKKGLKDKILNKAKNLIKGGNGEHLNFEVNSIDDVLSDPDLENEIKLFDEPTEDKIKSPIEEASEDNQEWEWVEEGSEDDDGLSLTNILDEPETSQSADSETADNQEWEWVEEEMPENNLETSSSDVSEISEPNISNSEIDASSQDDQEWEWVEEEPEAQQEEAIKTSDNQENEWVWEYDDSENQADSEAEEWVWEYEEAPEPEKSAVDDEPLAFESQHYEPEGQKEERPKPLSSKGLLEKESLFKFDDKTTKSAPSAPLEIVEQAKDDTSFRNELETLEKPDNSETINLGRFIGTDDVTLNLKNDPIIEDIELVNDNFLYNQADGGGDSDDIYNK
ncbi:MAG: hypothetical protein PHE89_02385 [Alphaproteobacteria bacterium]|nr:hypothetical protein [Alphaproteobacteria bacterium]